MVAWAVAMGMVAIVSRATDNPVAGSRETHARSPTFDGMMDVVHRVPGGHHEPVTKPTERTAGTARQRRGTVVESANRAGACWGGCLCSWPSAEGLGSTGSCTPGAHRLRHLCPTRPGSG